MHRLLIIILSVNNQYCIRIGRKKLAHLVEGQGAILRRLLKFMELSPCQPFAVIVIRPQITKGLLQIIVVPTMRTHQNAIRRIFQIYFEDAKSTIVIMHEGLCRLSVNLLAQTTEGMSDSLLLRPGRIQSLTNTVMVNDRNRHIIIRQIIHAAIQMFLHEAGRNVERPIDTEYRKTTRITDQCLLISLSTPIEFVGHGTQFIRVLIQTKSDG